MQSLLSPSRENQPCPSPVEIWQLLLKHLLKQHYGPTLNDTPLSNESVIRDHIEAGISVCDAVNYLVEEYGLIRTDRCGFTVMEQSPFISSIDILRARKATGLMKRNSYKAVTTVTAVFVTTETSINKGATVKISMNVEADGINALALNMGKIAVEVDGVEIEELIYIVNENGYTLTIADEPGKLIVESPLPAAVKFSGIQCSTAHITQDDNTLLHALSQQHQPYDNAKWVHYTGSGYLVRLDAWSFPVLQLKRRGLSRPCRKLIVTLIHRYNINSIHLDAFGAQLPGFETFDW